MKILSGLISGLILSLFMLCSMELVGNSKAEELKFCTGASEVFWKYLWPFFEDQYAVNAICLRDESLDFCEEIIKCGVSHLAKTMTYFYRDRIKNVTVKPNRRMFDVSHEGMIFFADSVEKLKMRLKQLSLLDPTGKAVAVSINSKPEEINDLLKSSWNRFKIMNVIAVRVITDSTKDRSKPKRTFKEYGEEKHIKYFKNMNRNMFHSNIFHHFLHHHNDEESKTSLTDIIDTFTKIPELEFFVYDPFAIRNGVRGYTRRMILQNNINISANKVSNFHRNLLKNVHKYPIRVCIFPYEGSAYPIKYSGDGNVTKYALKDGETIDALMKTINFKPLYYEPQDGLKFGNAGANQTYTGALKELFSGEAELIANMRAMQDYGEINSEFLFPADRMTFAFLVPKMGVSTSISFFGIYNLDMSVSLVITYILMISMWHLLQMVYKEYFMPSFWKKSGFIDVIFILFSAMLLVPQKERSLRYERILHTCMIIFSMIICYHYQGTMVELLTNSKKSLDINTVADLAASDLKVITKSEFSTFLRDIALYSDDPNYKKLYERQEISEGVIASIDRVILQKDVAYLTYVYVCKYFQLTNYSSTGEDLVHFTKQGPPSRYTSMMVPLTSPYSDRFNDVLLRIIESGLVPKWKMDEIFAINLMNLDRYRIAVEKLNNVYTMQELWFVFLMWSVCCTISFMVLILEILVARKGVGKRRKIIGNKAKIKIVLNKNKIVYR